MVPSIKLEPARSYLHPGDSITVDCKSSSPDSTVTWKREGDQRLPSNIRVSTNSNRKSLRILNVIQICFLCFSIYSNKVFNCSSQMHKKVMPEDIFAFAVLAMAKNLSPNTN